MGVVLGRLGSRQQQRRGAALSARELGLRERFHIRGQTHLIAKLYGAGQLDGVSSRWTLMMQVDEPVP